MSGLLLSVLPFALGAAVSPTLLTLELLILSGRTQPKARAWMFVIGAAGTLFVFGFVCATVLGNVGLTDDAPPNPWSIAAKALLALLLLALGIRQLRPKKTAGEQHHGRVAAHLQTARLPFFVGIGAAAMLTNFSTLVLYLPAIHLIVHSDDPSATKTTAYALLFLVTIRPLRAAGAGGVAGGPPVGRTAGPAERVGDEALPPDQRGHLLRVRRHSRVQRGQGSTRRVE